MGQSHPRSASYLYNYEYVCSKTQQPYGFGKVLQDTVTKEQLFEVALDSQGSNELLQLAREIEAKLHAVRSPYVLRLANWAAHEDGRVSLYYEYCPKTLDREIQARKKAKRRFSEEEMVYLLYAMASVGCTLERAGSAHKDIRPQNVLMLGDNSVKLAPVGTFPYDMDGLKKYLCFHEYAYLSCEMQNKTSSDWNASDVYASGLTLLDAMSLTFSYDIIDQPDPAKKEALLEKRLLALKPHYSPALLLIARKMLETQPHKRIAFKDLDSHLHPHAPLIQQLQPVDLAITRTVPRLPSPLQLPAIHEYTPTSLVTTRAFKRINPQKTARAPQLPSRTISPAQRHSVSPLLNIRKFVTPLRTNVSPPPQQTVFTKHNHLSPFHKQQNLSAILSTRNCKSPFAYSKTMTPAYSKGTPNVSFSPSRKISLQRSTMPQSSYASKGKDEVRSPYTQSPQSNMKLSEVDQLIDTTLLKAQMILREFGGNI